MTDKGWLESLEEEANQKIINTPTRELGPAGKLMKQSLLETPFTSDSGWARIKSRGWIIGISKDQRPDFVWDPGVYAGMEVTINGERFLCVGVEMFRPLISPEHPYSHDFGLLVKELDV